MTRGRQETFRFVVLADTHLRPEGGEEFATPWQSTRVANDRSRFVVREIERIRPAFVVHLGDMVHPVPAMEDYGMAVATYREIFEKLSAPLHTIPGNHDIGDKPGARMPAPNASEQTVAVYRRHFGDTYSAFEQDGCRFVLINSPILSSGLAEEEKQRDWLETQLSSSAGQRVFLFTHYPPFLYEPDEPSHYDNTDEPARTWLLGLIERHGVEAVFAGHVHNFFYHRYGVADLYVVPSVAQVRQDYSELFRIGPAAEYGRNDTQKLGFYVVSVYADGHRVRFVKTAGRTLQRNGASGESTDGILTGCGGFEATATPPLPLGVELSHAWSETVDLPLNYLVDGFLRKRMHNDYPMLALWGMGIRGVRVPAVDLLDVATRVRIALLRRRGHEVGALALGVPGEDIIESLRPDEGLIDGLEIVLPIEEMQQSAEALTALRERVASPVFISPLETSADSLVALSKGAYVVRHGWRCSEPGVEPLLTELREALEVGGFSFRVTQGEEPWEALQRIAPLVDRLGCGACVTVQIAADSPAQVVQNDRAIANRVAEAAAAAVSFPQVRVVLDTFADVDRGYYVRNGLVDRRFNPRPAGAVLAHLAEALPGRIPPAGAGCKKGLSLGRRLVWDCGRESLALLLPDPGAERATYGDWLAKTSNQIVVQNLSTGERRVARMTDTVAEAPVLVVAETDDAASHGRR